MICSSHELLAETAEALLRPRTRGRQTYDANDIATFCRRLAQVSDLVTNLPEIRAVERDPKDDMIVATALACRADYLVTGDRHLLDLDPYEGIRILSPRAFLDEPPMKAGAAAVR